MWENLSLNDPNKLHSVPITKDDTKTLQMLERWMAILKALRSGTKEHDALAKLMGFGYYLLRGEIMFAYVVCLVDIAFVVSFVSRFLLVLIVNTLKLSSFKKLAQYLCQMAGWGLMYWCHEVNMELPSVPFDLVLADYTLPKFTLYGLKQHIVTIDALPTICLKTLHSYCGFGLSFVGAVVLYKAMLQAIIVATTSTDAKFIAAVSATKMTKYICILFKEILMEKIEPTPLFINNKACIHMINKSKPHPAVVTLEFSTLPFKNGRAKNLIACHLSGWIMHGLINPADGNSIDPVGTSQPLVYGPLLQMPRWLDL